MSQCNFRAPNGEPSLLYQQLENKFGPIKAEQYWYETKSEEFKKRFPEVPLDTNEEIQGEWATKIFSNNAQALSDGKSEQASVSLTPDMFTKDGSSEDKITNRIKQLYDTAAKNPEKQYQVPFKRNTPGIKQVGAPRLTMTRLSELFLQFPIPDNVKFDPTFEGLMSVTPTRIMNGVTIIPPTTIPINAKMLQDSKDENFLKVRDAMGAPTGGYFSYEKQQEAIDSIIYLIYSRYMKGVKSIQDIKSGTEQILKAAFTRHLEIAGGKKFKGFEDITKEMAERRAQDLQDIINVFNVKGDSNNLWTFTLNRLKIYGLNVKGLDSTNDPEVPQNLVDSNDGTAMRDFRDSSFELDKKDTASSRMKLFLSSIEESEERRMVRMAFTSALVRDNILSGKKNTTIRSAEVAQELGLIKKGDSAVTRIDGKSIKVTSLGPITADQMDVFADTAYEEGVDLKPGMVAYSLTPMNDESSLAVRKNYLGMPKLINFEDAFQKLMALLADQTPSINNFMSLMHQSSDPIIRRVAEKLDRESEEVKNEFVSVMSNQYQQFSVVMFGKQTASDGITRIQSRTFMANYSSQLNVLQRSWEQNQKQAPIAQRDAVGNIVINRELAGDLAAKLASVLNSGDYGMAGMQLFQDLMKANGIEMPGMFFENFAKNALNLTKGTRLQGNFERQFQFNKDGSPAGIISAMISRLNGSQVKSENEEVENSFQVNNPMYTEGTAMNILARAAIPFEPMVYSNSHRSSEGKSIYDHGLHTSLSHKVRRLREEEQYRDQKSKTYINEHNSLLKAMQDDPELRDRFQVTYMDGLKPEYMKGASGVSRTDMSFREQLLYSMALFEKRGNAKYADYISLTHSDKTTTPVFLNGPRIAIVTGQTVSTGPQGGTRVQSITKEVYQAFYNLFLDEYNRVTKTKDNYNSDQFDKGKQFFYAMPEFNIDNMKKMVERGDLTKEEFNSLWTDLGAIKPIETKEARQLLLKMFNRRIETLTNRTLQSWRNEGLVTKESLPFSIKYMNRLLTGIGITSQETYDTGDIKYAYFSPTGGQLSTENVTQIAATLAARDYAVNHFIFNISSSRLMYGDPAEVFKKTIPATLVEYSKRLAKDIAPGKDGEWSHSPSYTSITVEDWEGAASEVASLVSAYGEEVNATDAQELITTQEYLNGKYAIGQISKQVFDEMSKIISDAAGGYYEFTKPEHKLAMVPQKPVYVGEGQLDRGVILTHYIKSSAYPLLPAFTAGKELESLRVAMEKNGIDRLNYKSASKMGRPAAKIKLFNKDGSMNMAALSSPEFTGKDTEGNPVPSARQTLDRSGFRIQQEVPHDPDKRKIKMVTQMNVLITQGIATINEPFIFQGNKVSAQALMDLKSEVRKSLFNIQADKVRKQMGIEDGVIKDFGKLYDSLLEEASSRAGYTINDIGLLAYRNENNEPLMPLLFSPSRSRFESLLMNKIGTMAEMKMYGHSFVQASSAGLKKISNDLSDIDKSRIVFAGDYRGGELKTIRHEDGTVKAAQVLVPFSFFGSKGKLNIKDYIKTDENGYQVVDTDKLPAEFLQLVGARIPNQGHSSMLPIEIVGFLPDEMQDTIVVPAAITKQMGSDFDVDKLYTYQNPYAFSEGKLVPVTSEEDLLLKAYFDIHWSILTHPQMTERILSPLDKPDLKMEADKVPLPADTDYFDAIEQLQSFQSQKFAKQLVGFTALTLTNNTVFEPLHITLGQTRLDENTGERKVYPFAFEYVDPEGQVHELGQLSGYGESTNYDLSDTPKRTKHDNIVVVLSGFLDHAKDPVTPQINLNLYTYNAAAALLRLQSSSNVAMGIPELAALLRQPVIMEYSKAMSAGNDTLSETFEADLHTKVMSELGNKYSKLADSTTEDFAQLNLAELRDDWTAKDGKPFYERQLKVLNTFNALWKIGRQLADIQSAFNWDVNGAGPSILQAMSKETVINDTAVANMIPRGIVINDMDQMYNTEKGYITDHIMETIKGPALQIFPYQKLQPLIDKFKDVTGNGFVSPKATQAIIDGYLAYQWTSAPVWGTDQAATSDRVRLMYSGSHGPSLAKRIQDAKISWGRANYLLQRMDTNITTTGSGPDFVSYSLGISNGFDAIEVSRSWNNLLTSDDPVQKQLGEDLARYAILTGNTSTLARHIPISYILGTSLLEATQELKANDAVSEVFMKQFLQHYPQYTKQVSADFKETGNTYEQYPEVFKVLPINQEREDHPGRNLWIHGDDGLLQYPEFLSYRDTTTNSWILYQQVSYLRYQRIDTLGNSQIDEYSPTIGQSVLPSNKAYQTDKKDTITASQLYGMEKKGGWAEFSGVLAQIEASPTQPTLYRQMSGMINKMKPVIESNIIEIITGQPVSPFIFEFTNQLKGLDAEMNSLENKLWISSSLHYSDFAKTMIHEMIHYHTAVTTTVFDVEDNLEYYKNKLTPANLAKLLQLSRAMKAQSPDIYERVKLLNDIREQALAQFGKENVNDGTEFYKKMEYALSSNTEFLAHIFTDKDVMKWLNNRRANVEKTLWDKIADAIAAIMKSVAEFMGISIEHGSLLEESVKRAMDIMSMDNALPTLTVKGVLDFNPEIFKNATIASAPLNQNSNFKKLNTIIARLQDQRREIAQTFTGTITPDQAARKRKLLDDLDREIAKFKDEQDLALIAQTGKIQLKWVNEIMARKSATANDIMVADRILELWTNLITVMYGDATNAAKIDKDWSEIASDAQVKRQQLTSMAIELMIKESKGVLSKRDFTQKELEDPSWVQVRLRGLSSAAKSKALQYVTTYMEDTGRMVNEEVLRVLKDTEKLEKDFITYAGSRSNLKTVYQKLMQENDNKSAWGLIRRYSPQWYGFLVGSKKDREKRIDVINRDKGLSSKQKSSMRRIAWEDYWKIMNNNGAFVDTRLFFTETGEDHPAFNKAYQDLVNDIGENQAKAAVQKARERYQKYLDEKEVFTDMMDADVVDGTKTREEADKEVQAWVSRYSPNVFFHNFKNNLSVFNDNVTDRFVIVVPKAKHTKYFDSKFSEMEKDQKLYELYDCLSNTLNKLKSYLPKYVQYQMGDNFLPAVAKGLVSDISSLPEYVKGMPERFIRTLTASSQEENRKGSEKIPINYVDTSTQKDPAEIAKRSKDLVKITEIFAAMAIHYKHFANAKDVIDMGQSIIREIDRTRIRDGKIVNEQGQVLQAPEGLKNAIDALQYMKEYVMFKKARALEGNSGLKVYSTNPITQRKIANRVKELVIKKKDLDGKLFTGDIDGIEWQEQSRVINDELKKYDGRTVYGSKVGDKLISIAQAKALSFNPFSAVANFTFGVVSSAIFANGNQEFGNKQFRQALRIMMSSTSKWLSFGIANGQQSTKIMNVMNRLGVMGDVVESQYGELKHRERTPKWKKTINPYNWMRSGDYFCRGLNTVATLLKQTVKVTEDGVEKEITLWEALDENGEWKESQYGKRPEYFSEKVEDQTEWNKIRDKVARVNMAVMGNTDHVSPKMANKWIIGRLLGQFRLSWLPEGWYNRWAEEKFDVQLGRNTKGRFTTYKDLGIGGSLKVLWKQYLSVVSKVDPFTGQHKMNGEQISDADVENMRKNFAEINFYLMVLAGIMMLKSMSGDDDDDDSKALQIMINMAIRMKQDVAFYSSPDVFDTVTRNAVPSFGVIKDYTKLMDASWKWMTEDDYTADRWLLKMTHAGLPIPQATLVNKIKYMSERDLDDLSR